MRYRLVNVHLGQNNQILSRDFNAFYETSLGSINAVADIAKSLNPTPEQITAIDREIGRLRDYTVPLAPVPAPTSCPQASVPAGNSNQAWLVAAGTLLVGAAFGYFVL